jgi:tripartite-type tricarboxylate transporter receptor subunit TctC
MMAKSAPDGYTLTTVIAAHSANPSLYAKMPFDVMNDITPVALSGIAPLILTANNAFPPNSITEMVAYVKARPGQFNFGSSGIGAAAHLAMEQFMMTHGLKMQLSPYKGTQPALTDLIGGQVDATFDTMVSVMPHVKSGKVKVLAIASAKRSALLPDVQTFQEQGVPLVTGTWFGVVAPASTPATIVERLNSEVLAIAKEDAAFIKKLNDEGAEFAGGTPGEFGAFIKVDQERWRKVIAESGIKAE